MIAKVKSSNTVELRSKYLAPNPIFGYKQQLKLIEGGTDDYYTNWIKAKDIQGTDLEFMMFLTKNNINKSIYIGFIFDNWGQVSRNIITLDTNGFRIVGENGSFDMPELDVTEESLPDDGIFRIRANCYLYESDQLDSRDDWSLMKPKRDEESIPFGISIGGEL